MMNIHAMFTYLCPSSKIRRFLFTACGCIINVGKEISESVIKWNVGKGKSFKNAIHLIMKKSAKKQVQFELDPPILNLKLTCIKTHVI